MAEEGKDNPVVLIAIDESKQSMHAFNCKYFFYIVF